MTDRQSETRTTMPSPKILERYEDLRQQALRRVDPVHRGSGLALFVRKGMMSWMEACSRCLAGVATKPEIQPGVDQVSPVQASRELVSILANMALITRLETVR